MPVYNLANVLGMGTDQINSMFSNPQFQQQFGAMFANNPNMYSGIGNLYTNNPTFKAAFGQLANQDWGSAQPTDPRTSTGGGGSATAPVYSGPGASPYQLTPGNPVNYASMYQPPSLYNLSLGGNGLFGITQNAPQAPIPATGPYDPSSLAQFNTRPQTTAGLMAAQQAALPKPKSPTFFEQILPYVTAAAQVAGAAFGA